MYWSRTLIPTLKETPQEAESLAHKLLLRAGLARMLMAGAYSYLPLGLRVLSNIEKIIRQEMDSCGASELLLPALQPLELWVKSGRDKDIGEVMIRLVDRRGRKVCLGPTHEEVITDLVASLVSSYRQLPLMLYQIQTKFRDEIRPRFGLVRACEFIMKDAYSFDRDEAGLDRNYQAVLSAYLRIFKRCGLKILVQEADPGVMGGNVSHEFMVPAGDGEDVVISCSQCAMTVPFNEGNQPVCPKCGTVMRKVNCIEVGHIFKLGTKYTSVLGAKVLDEDGKLKPIVMGCYGIGVSRLISAVIEQNHDENGITWPQEVAPYKVMIIPLDTADNNTKVLAESVYKDLSDAGIEPLLDDRDERAGVKFKDADLIGIPLQIIIGREPAKSGKLELKARNSAEKTVDDKEKILKRIMTLADGQA